MSQGNLLFIEEKEEKVKTVTLLMVYALVGGFNYPY